MRDIIETIADSLSEEAFAQSFTIIKHDPLWRNPRKGKCLYVYPSRTFDGDYRTTGSVQDVHEIFIEYVEPAAGQTKNLKRDEDAELAAYDVAKDVRAWCRENQSLPVASVTRLEHVETRYAPEVPREALVRYSRTTIHARTDESYG